MSAIVQLLVISVGLSTDALSVSIAGGLRSKTPKALQAVKVAVFFGSFQAVMPLLGWIIGEIIRDAVSAVGYWIAFVLLTIIGIRMIFESLGNNTIENENFLKFKTLILLSVATSIDAFIVGITLNLLEIPLLISISIIGVTTFFLCFLGFLFGNKLGTLFGQRAGVSGGLVIIAIGIKILLEHLI